MSLPPPPFINWLYLLHSPLKMPVGDSPSDHAIRHPRHRLHLPRQPLDFSHPCRRLHLLNLNRDVLSAISDSCPPYDALQLAMTCKDAYTFAIPRLLSDVSIGDPGSDDGPDRLKSFCAYMLAAPDRIKHLRSLRLLEGAFCPTNPRREGRDGWGEDFSPADLLTKLLLQAHNIRLLHIRDAEPLFQKHPSVLEALAQLPRLHDLSLYYIGNSSLKCMSLLRSTPAIIENGLWKDGPRPQGDITPFGPYVTSLKHLKLWECGCMLESIVDRHVWPHVHTLDIGGRIAKISELAHAFPNLRRLTFFREFSVKQETGPALCWPVLDYLQTSAPIPSLSSPVRQLQLQYPIGRNDLKSLPFMEKTNPVVLRITMSPTIPQSMFERMMTYMPSLRYLELFLDEHNGRSGMDWHTFADWVERNLEVMRSTSLVGLCLTYPTVGSTSTLPEVQRRRMKTIARTLARAIKSLVYVGVGFQDDKGSMYDCDCIWYQVQSRPASDDTHILHELPRVEGKLMRESLQDTARG